MDIVKTEGVDARSAEPFAIGVVMEAVNTEGPGESPLGIGVVAGEGGV